ncbi:MAG: diguanylate cyclase [Cytophaga sp.]|nr:diguanylate cyclase [Undibacterium sp.]
MSMSHNNGLYQNNVYMLAERFFIQDESEILKLHAHKYNFDILFYSKMESFIFAMLGANESDLFVVDLDVLHNHQSGQPSQSMFLRDLLKPLPDNHQYIYLETEKQGSRYLLQKMLVDTNCLAYAEKPFSSEDLIDNLFNLFAQRKRDDQGKVLVLGDSVPLDEALFSRHNIAIKRHEAFQTLHTEVKHWLPDVVVIESAMFAGAESLAEIVQKNIATDPSLEIIFLQTENDTALSETAIDAGFDVIMMHQTNHITSSQIINRINKIRTNKNLISRDRATGLLNKIGYKKRAQERIYEAERAAIPLAAVIFDIDKFKTINDTWGHHFGDIVIKRLSMFLGQFLEDKALLSRFGGEEFVMLFWDADHDKIIARLNEMREGFNAIEFEIAPGQFKQFSISGGVAFYPQCKTENALFLQADAALYKAKSGGRNQICE